MAVFYECAGCSARPSSRRVVQEFDQDGDGEVDLDEFRAAVTVRLYKIRPPRNCLWGPSNILYTEYLLYKIFLIGPG
jgi:hypothetical protein